MLNPFLAGRLIYLRPLGHSDAPVLVGYVKDASVRRALRIDRPITLAEEEEFIERVGKSREEVVFGIAACESDRLLGVVGLHLIEAANRQAQLGIFIGDPSEWGKGYGSEATRLVVEHAFDTLDLNRVWLHVLEDNARAIRAYQRVGFSQGGVLRQAVFREGCYLDLITMAILREDWEKGKAHPSSS